MTAEEVFEIHRFDGLHHGRLDIGYLTEWNPMDRDPIGCKQNVRAIDESNKCVVVRMSNRSGNHLHALPAEVDVQPVGISYVWGTDITDGTASELGTGKHAVVIGVV